MMPVYGLRLLVAIITFVVGVGAGRLFGSESKPCGRAVVSYAPVHVAPPRIVRGGVLQMKTIDKRSPAYPHYAKVANVSGQVSVKVEVDESGRVTKAKAVTGFGMLPEAAEKDALATRFSPTLLSGQPVRVSGDILYDFVLD